MKSFQHNDKKNGPPPDDPGDRGVNFYGENDSNQTLESTTDADALLARELVHPVSGLFVGPCSGGILIRRGCHGYRVSAEHAYVALKAVELARPGIAFGALCEALANLTGLAVDDLLNWKVLRVVVSGEPAHPWGKGTWGDLGDKIGHWNELYISGQYEQLWENESVSSELVGVYLALGLPGNPRCLDLGCGSGQDLLFLAGRGCRVTGVDMSREALSIVRCRFEEKRLRVNLIEGDALNLPLENSTFDFITDRGCFHHITRSDRPRYAHEIARLLSVGGHFLLRGTVIADGLWVPIEAPELESLFDSQVFERSPVLAYNFGGSSPIQGAIILMRKK